MARTALKRVRGNYHVSVLYEPIVLQMSPDNRGFTGDRMPQVAYPFIPYLTVQFKGS